MTTAMPLLSSEHLRPQTPSPPEAINYVEGLGDLTSAFWPYSTEVSTVHLCHQVLLHTEL